MQHWEKCCIFADEFDNLIKLIIMSVRIITLIGVLLLFVTPLFAYRDSVDYDNGNSGIY